MKPAPRLDHVDGLRGVAALWVVVYHSYVFFYESTRGSSGPLLRGMSRGHLGVPMFLVLSGFCLALPCLRAERFSIDLGAFARRRAWRILPPYYLVLGSLAALVQLPLFHRAAVQKPTDGTDLLLHVFMLHNLSGEHILRLSGPFWSIALECQLYCAFPLLLGAMKRPWLPPALALAIGACAWTLGPREPSLPAFAWWHSLPSLLILFVLGMLAALGVARGRRLGEPAAALGLSLIAAVYWIPASGPVARLVCQLSAALGTALFLVCGEDTFIVRALRSRPLVRLGVASYTLYLTHNPLISLAGKLATARLAGWAVHLAAALSILVAVGIALALFPLIERPFHELARRRASAPHSSIAPAP